MTTIHIYFLNGNIKMTEKVKIGFPFTPSIEKDMKMFYDSLNEKDQRHYAALEAKKLCYGGITYIAKLFNYTRPTVHDGLEELKKKIS
jgi:hypothetical protein